MKKILIILLTLLSLSFTIPFYSTTFAANCTYEGEGKVGDALDTCLEGSALVDGSNVMVDGSGGFAQKIQNWVNNISLYLAVFAVLSIVYGALQLTISSGEDEKIKKAKDIIKWGIFGFVGLISVSAIISLIVKLMYSL